MAAQDDIFAHPASADKTEEERVADATAHFSRPIAVVLLVIEVFVTAGFLVYYHVGYDTMDLGPLQDAMNSNAFQEIPALVDALPEEFVTQNMKNNETIFVCIVTVVSFLAGVSAVRQLHRQGMAAAIVCQIALLSTVNMVMSNDEGMLAWSCAMTVICLLAATSLYRLSDAIQECRVGSEEQKPRIFFWSIAHATVCVGLLVVAVAFILLSAHVDVEGAVRNEHMVSWVSYTLGSAALVASVLGFVGGVSLRCFHARSLLVACMSGCFCLMSCGCFFIIWYGYAEEGLQGFCGFSESFTSLYGWDQEECDEMHRIVTAQLVFLLLLITMLGLTAWTAWQFSEVVQRAGIDATRGKESTPTGEGLKWTVGRTIQVAYLKLSGVRILCALNHLNVCLLCCLGFALLGFTISLHPDNDVMDGQLDALLKNCWVTISAVSLTLATSFSKSHFSFLEPRRVLMFTGFCQVWVVGAAFHAFFLFLYTYHEGFAVEEWLKEYVSSSVGYSGNRRDILLAISWVTGIIWTSQLLGTMIVFLELESEYNLHGFFIYRKEPMEARQTQQEVDLGDR